MDLPNCRYRISNTALQLVCSSPSVEVAGGIVTREMCQGLCPHVDQAPLRRDKLSQIRTEEDFASTDQPVLCACQSPLPLNAITPASAEPPVEGSGVKHAPINFIADNSVTVVIPNYNCGEYLKRCIESFRAQTLKCEIVVVDDASTDHSSDVLREYERQVKVVRHDRNRGANRARLSGINQSRSSWIVAADADAVYSPRFLESLVAKASHSTSVVYCGMRRALVNTGREQIINRANFNAHDLWWANYISMCSLVRRSVLPLDLMETTEYLEDWRLWLHLAASGCRFEAVNEVLFEAAVRPQGKSAQIESHPHRLAVEIASLRRPYAKLIGCDGPINVIIPAAGCADLTTDCLWHLARYSGLPVHVVYVDNGSLPSDIRRVEDAAGVLGLEMEVIRNKANLGFTKAVNQGIRASRGRHVLCLNNDCFIGPECVERMFRILHSTSQQIGAVGPLTGDHSRQSLRNIGHKGCDKSECNPDFDYLDAIAGSRLVGRQSFVRQERLLAFFCTLLNREAIAECGPLDERTSDFHCGLGADDEWCHRVSSAGWQLLVAMDAYAAHLGSRTFDRLGIDRRKLQQQALQRLRQIGYADP